MKTYTLRAKDIDKRWRVYDAEGQPLGRLATEIASALRGKDKATFTPHLDMGDFVIVTNATKVKFTGAKMEKKVYRHHTQYLGGLVEEPMVNLLKRKPRRVIELAVRRMLPKNTLGRHYLRRLKIYAGQDHPHEAQTPEKIEVQRKRLLPRPVNQTLGKAAAAR